MKQSDNRSEKRATSPGTQRDIAQKPEPEKDAVVPMTAQQIAEYWLRAYRQNPTTMSDLLHLVADHGIESGMARMRQTCPLCGAFIRGGNTGQCKKCGQEWDNGLSDDATAA